VCEYVCVLVCVFAVAQLHLSLQFGQLVCMRVCVCLYMCVCVRACVCVCASFGAFLQWHTAHC